MSEAAVQQSVMAGDDREFLSFVFPSTEGLRRP